MLSPAKARTQPPDAVVTSDASGKWGCGVFWKLTWFQFAWEEPLYNLSIAIQELIPIIVAAAIWGKHWKGYSVQCQSDNQTVVAVLTTRTSKEPHLMHLLRCLFFFEAYWDFSLYGSYLPGYQNDLADDLSRNHLSSFLSKVPEMNAVPTPIPSALKDLLLHSKPDWLSSNWRQFVFN